MRQPLVMGNWKMHGALAANAELIKALASLLPEKRQAHIAICPPAVYLTQVLVELEQSQSGIALAAQNVCAQAPDAGAYTGETSAQMLADLAVDYCLVGHSERREYFGESNEVVAQKFKQLQTQGITPVLCVGETLEQREADKTLAVIEAQINAVLDVVGIEAFAQAVIAYEPVWAIGTGKTASPEQAQEIHAFIRGLIAKGDANVAKQLQLLYGGSVKAENASELFAMADIDGALVGGASLNAEQFSAICKAAE